MNEFDLTIRLRNNRLRQRRRESGRTAKEISEAIGVGLLTYYGYESLRLQPMGKDRQGLPRWKPSAIKIAEFYGVDPAELWPAEVLEVTDPVQTTTISATDVALLAGQLDFVVQALGPGTAERAVSDAQDRQCVRDAMHRELSDTEQAVMRLYYYEGMRMPEIAKVLGLTTQGVSAAHCKAVSKLRSPLLRAGVQREQ